MCRFIFLIVYLVAVFCQLVHGQAINLIQVDVWRDTIQAQSSGTFTNRVTFRNTGSQPVRLSLAATSSTAIQLVTTLPPSVLIPPGQSMMIPVKGVLNQQTDSLAYKVVLSFEDSTSLIRGAVVFTIQLKQSWQPVVTLYPHDEPILLYSGIETAKLPLRLVHNRLHPSHLFIDVASAPEGIDRTAFPLEITLTGRQDTTLSIRCVPTNYWSVNTPYQFIVSVRDEMGSVVGNVLYQVAVASTVKRFSANNPTLLSPYGISTAVGQVSDHQWLREVQAWGSDSLGRNQLDFRLHYMNYGPGQMQQLQNSFVSLRNEQAMVRVGSLYDYHELALLGRGLKVNLNQSDHQWTFWAVNTNANWFNSSGNTLSGNVLSARYDKQLASLPGGSWSASTSYFSKAYSQRRGFLNFGSFQFHGEGRHTVEVLGAQSVEFTRQGGTPTYGWAGKINYSYHSPSVDWVVRTYWSNPVYSGFQKGALLLDSRLTVRLTDVTTVSLRYSQVQYNQREFYTAVNWNQRLFGNSQAEISITRQWNNWLLGVRPYWYAQIDRANPYSQGADLYRIAPFLLFKHKGHQHLDLTYDIGTYQNRRPATNQSAIVSQRLLGSLGFGPFSLWAYWQQGPYYLGDIRPEQSSRTTISSITPSIDYTLLQQRLHGNIGLNYLYDSYSTGSRAQLMSRVRYDITSDLTIRAESNMTVFSQLEQLAYSQYRVEMTKRFSNLSFRRRGQLKLSFFEDINGNGQHESGERWMDSLLVSVNGNTLLTNQKGEILYRNLTPGAYTVSTVSINRFGEPVPYREIIMVNGRIQRQIPLARTFRVMGKLISQVSAYERQPILADRFTLEVQQNKQTVLRCSPLPDGSFGLPLGPGIYTLLVYDLGRQPASVVQSVPFTLTTFGQYPSLQLVLDAATRPVEIKRFGTTAKM